MNYAAHIAPICLPQVGRDPEVFRSSLLLLSLAPIGVLNVMMSDYKPNASATTVTLNCYNLINGTHARNNQIHHHHKKYLKISSPARHSGICRWLGRHHPRRPAWSPCLSHPQGTEEADGVAGVALNVTRMAI